MKKDSQTRKPSMALVALLFLLLLLPGLPGKAWAATNWIDAGEAAKVGAADATDVDVTLNGTTYTVHTPAGLAWIAWVTNGNKTSTNNPLYPEKYGFADCTVTLANDIDLSGGLWTPIGEESKSFRGIFDGAGKRVIGMKIEMNITTGLGLAGLFGWAKGPSEIPIEIKNIGVDIESVSVTLDRRVGSIGAAGLVGRCENCRIENCYVTGGPITATISREGDDLQAYAGGIVGVIDEEWMTVKVTEIKNCYSTVAVTVNGPFEVYAGGIAGRVNENDKLSYCYATGTIIGGLTKENNSIYVGGLTGGIFMPKIHNSLALSWDIKVNGKQTSKYEVGRISSMSKINQSNNNYASSHTEVYVGDAVQSITTNDATDKNGAVIWLETPLESILAADGNTGAWVFTDDHLPTLSGFEEGTQPELLKTDYLETGALTLGSDALTLKYDEAAPAPAYWMHKVTGADDATYQPFSGTLTGTGTALVTITGGTATASEVVPLTFAKDASITVATGTALMAETDVFLKVANGGTATLKTADATDATLRVADAAKVTVKTDGTGVLQLQAASKAVELAGTGTGTVTGLMQWTWTEAPVAASQIVVKTSPAATPVATFTADGTSKSFACNPAAPAPVTVAVGTEIQEGMPAGSTDPVSLFAYADPVAQAFISFTDMKKSSTVVEPEPDPDPDPTPEPDPDPTPEPDPDPVPPVYYNVVLPSVEGVVTDPIAGMYACESWSSFTFALTLAADYDQSVPVVTTSRGETLTPRPSDGRYEIKYVREDLSILISGVSLNDENPTANADVRTDAVRVWAADGVVHIFTPVAAEVRLVSFSGALLKSARVPSGDSMMQAPEGPCIIQVGNQSFKIVQ